MGRGKRGRTVRDAQIIAEPTPEQMTSAKFELNDVHDKNGAKQITIGKAYRRKPMIEILLNARTLTVEEYRALRHYRHHADLADRSPIRDSLCLQRGGRGGGPTITTLNACQVRDDCERAAGSLADILRAVVVYDWSLSQWAMEQGGAVQIERDTNGRPHSRMEPRRKWLEIARLEIRMAARRVQAELDA